MRREHREKIHANARALLYSGAEPTWLKALARADAELICGAKAKSTDKPCQARPLPGRKIACRECKPRRRYGSAA